ncbi:MAG: hypothetical protein EXS10_06930 [Phycisphaerales bacterium]|nr:hypothetical protein [Phycisphaerales bacterium]
MPIETTIQPRQKLIHVGYTVACLGFGIWGGYDYAVKIPAQETAFADFTALSLAKDEFEVKSRAIPLGVDDAKRYNEVKAELAGRFAEAPTPVGEYDRAVQLWLFVISCGVLGTPYFPWMLWKKSKRFFRLDDDGTLHTDEGTFTTEQITGIDMSRWMSKSVATITIDGGVKIPIDDYWFRNGDLIVGAIAHRFHPEEWTMEGRDVKKLAAQEAKKRRLAAAETESTDA